GLRALFARVLDCAGKLFQERAEAQPFEQRLQSRRLRSWRDAGLELELYGCGAVQRHEASGERHVLGMSRQVLAQLRREVVEVLHDGCSRTVLSDELGGCLGANALGSGDV